MHRPLVPPQLTPEAPAMTQPDPQSLKVRTFPSSPPSERKKRHHHSHKSDQETEPVYEPKGNVIEFQIKDGWAVAYGDLILGKPDPANQVLHGLYEAPDPQAWESPTIPYLISPELPNPERVEQAIEYLKKYTRILFIPYQGQKDGVIFEPGAENCLSFLGKIGGVQPIRLSAQCHMTEILHEILHTLGFIHEQSRPDRDQFVQILWENIEPKYQSQFAMVPSSFMRAIKDSPFDYRSVMLYRPDSFATTAGSLTLKSRTYEPVSPTSYGLSEYDIKRLYRLFDM